MPPGEDDLTRRSQQGDTEAFGELVKQYAGRATGLAVVLVGNHADAVDLSQEAFVRAWRNIRSLHDHSLFFAWYCRILRNGCYTWLKRRGRRQAVPLADNEQASPDADPA